MSPVPFAFVHIDMLTEYSGIHFGSLKINAVFEPQSPPDALLDVWGGWANSPLAVQRTRRMQGNRLTVWCLGISCSIHKFSPLKSWVSWRLSPDPQRSVKPHGLLFL